VAGSIAPFTQDVKKRRVFYIPGYDPMLPRRYREIYRREGIEQAEISHYDLAISALRGRKNYAWLAETTIGNAQTTAEVEFLLWSDIVQSSMGRNIVATYVLLARLVWIYLSTGALFRLARLRKGPIIAALYPVISLILQLILACFVAGEVGFAVSRMTFLALGWIVGAATLTALMVWFKRIDRRFLGYYLLHDYAFSAQYSGANPPELDVRMRVFADDISAALASDCDEVLLVGHSSGAHIGVMVLADLLRTNGGREAGPKLGFLTLGQVVPMVSFLPRADRLRRDLAFLSQQSCLTWVDVSAPGDGGSFALCDPVSVSGADPAQIRRWPLVLSAAFTQSLSAEKLGAMRWNFFKRHFQYLNAFDRPKEYDYFQITAGPVSLEERFKGCMPSPSRIETPLCKYSVTH